MFLNRAAVRASRLFVHPPLSIREVRCGTRGLVRKSVPFLQDSRLARAKVSAAAVERAVPAVDIQRRAAPLVVRGEPVVGVDARDGAGWLVRRSGSGVLAHESDGLRRRPWLAGPR